MGQKVAWFLKRLVVLLCCSLLTVTSCASNMTNVDPRQALAQSAFVLPLYTGNTSAGMLAQAPLRLLFYDPVTKDWKVYQGGDVQGVSLAYANDTLYWGDSQKSMALNRQQLTAVEHAEDLNKLLHISPTQTGSVSLYGSVKRSMDEQEEASSYSVLEVKAGQTSLTPVHEHFGGEVTQCADGSVWASITEIESEHAVTDWGSPNAAGYMKIFPDADQQYTKAYGLGNQAAFSYTLTCQDHMLYTLLVEVPDQVLLSEDASEPGQEDRKFELLSFDTRTGTFSCHAIEGLGQQALAEGKVPAWGSNQSLIVKDELLWISESAEVIATNLKTGSSKVKFDLVRSAELVDSPTLKLAMGQDNYRKNQYFYQGLRSSRFAFGQNQLMEISFAQSQPLVRVYSLETGKVLTERTLPKIEEYLSANYAIGDPIQTHSNQLY